MNNLVGIPPLIQLVDDSLSGKKRVVLDYSSRYVVHLMIELPTAAASCIVTHFIGFRRTCRRGNPRAVNRVAAVSVEIFRGAQMAASPAGQTPDRFHVIANDQTM